MRAEASILIPSRCEIWTISCFDWTGIDNTVGGLQDAAEKYPWHAIQINVAACRMYAGAAVALILDVPVVQVFPRIALMFAKP